jgi:hypothetical protein
MFYTPPLSFFKTQLPQDASLEHFYPTPFAEFIATSPSLQNK